MCLGTVSGAGELDANAALGSQTLLRLAEESRAEPLEGVGAGYDEDADATHRTLPMQYGRCETGDNSNRSSADEGRDDEGSPSMLGDPAELLRDPVRRERVAEFCEQGGDVGGVFRRGVAEKGRFHRACGWLVTIRPPWRKVPVPRERHPDSLRAYPEMTSKALSDSTWYSRQRETRPSSRTTMATPA